MKTIRLYYPEFYQANSSVKLTDDAFHHAFKVLRCRKGDLLELFDGKGTQAETEVLLVERRSATILIRQVEKIDRESPLQTILVQGVSKGERMDFVLQKATELGVTVIQPLLTERCNVQLDAARWQKRQLHWQRIIISACEQSGRNQLPHLLPVLNFDDFLKKNASSGFSQTYLLHPQQQKHLCDLVVDKKQPISFMVGSEGGFSDDEINTAKKTGITTVGLGPRVLRTETAGLSVLAIAQTLWGDF